MTIQKTVQKCHSTVSPLSLTFLLLPLFLHLSSTQQGEDDARLRVDTDSCHQHPARALHHMGTLTSEQITGLDKIKRPVALARWHHQVVADFSQ